MSTFAVLTIAASALGAVIAAEQSVAVALIITAGGIATAVLAMLGARRTRQSESGRVNARISTNRQILDDHDFQLRELAQTVAFQKSTLAHLSADVEHARRQTEECEQREAVLQGRVDELHALVVDLAGRV